MFDLAHVFLGATSLPSVHDPLVQQLADLSTPLQQTLPHVTIPQMPSAPYIDAHAERVTDLLNLAYDRMQNYEVMSKAERGEALLDAMRYQVAIDILKGKDQERGQEVEREVDQGRDLER